MTKTALIAILNDWNFWNNRPKTGIPRPTYAERLSAALGTPHIIVITGPRRAGKSFVMRQMIQNLIAQGIPPNECVTINFEDPRLGTLDAALVQKIYDTYVEYLNPKGTPYIFLDEIQEAAGWEKWARTMHELGKARLIISGSNAKLLSRELSTLLTGRHVDVTVFPLSFREFLSFREPAPDEVSTNRLMRDYLECGGFPEVTLSDEKKQILLRYYDDIVTKDLIHRFNIRKSEHMKNLAQFFLSNTATQMTFNSCAKFLELSVDTVEKFSGYLRDAYLFFLVKRYSPRLKEQGKSPRKLYCIDNGLSNMVGFNTSPNTGRLLEQAVFQELARRQLNIPDASLFYWKDSNHREVDFVVKDGFNIRQLIQVCADIHDPKTKKRELRSLIRAMEEFGLQEGMIITMDHAAEETIDGKTIACIPIRKWLIPF